MLRFVRSILFVSLLIFTLFLPFIQTQASGETVYHVPVEQEVEKGLHAFLKRSFEEAKEMNAKTVILEMNTLGGLVTAAGEIGQLMDHYRDDFTIVAFVNDRAISAGAYIALKADQIFMSPSAKMGAAAVRTSSGGDADAKQQSFWLAEMISAAETADRNPLYAEAMVNAEKHLPNLRAGKGQLLTLTAAEAEQVKYSEGTVSSLQEVLVKLGLEEATVHSTEVTFAEQVARFVTHPIVIPILLSIASLGLIVELYSPGFGVPGTMGITALLLFFFGHLIAGLAGYETILLFVLGVSLIIAELFIPGGIAGTIGIIAVVGSIILAGANPMFMAVSVLIALVIAIIGMVIVMKFFGKKLHLLNRMVLMDATDTESGYVSNENRTELLGQQATTLTPLRPSGAIVLDGERIDVVSEGNYIEKGKFVEVVKVEGSRIVVRELRKEEETEV